MTAADLAPWFRGCSRLIVAKGKTFQEHALRGLDAGARAALVLGPSGKLRAPALVVDGALVVGFHEEVYAGLFGR